MNPKGRVYLVEDDDALRKATTRLLASHGFEVRAFATGEEFLDKYDVAHSGCLLLDLRLPGQSGLELQQTLELRGATPPIVFLTGHADVPTSVFAMKRGAIDFLEKPVREEELVAALERALERDTSTRKEQQQLARVQARYSSLTAREREVFAEIIAGRLNKQAALTLGIAERTVKLHRSRVLEKMEADSVADLVRMAEALELRPAGS
ncbi:MAG: response regulator transcription factor [Planctomycetes bacterium]|nr:response regulator transcription factor [Planctomycetota bacterium]